MAELVSNGNGIVIGNEGHDSLMAAQFANLANMSILDAVRDGGRNITETVHLTSKATELAVEKVGAANALATATGELRLMNAVLKECCDTRELIKTEGQLTRDLINQNTMQLLRDQLEQTRAQLIVATSAAERGHGG